MLYIHETHHCIGGQVEPFLHSLRHEWKPLIEASGAARLLWVWHHAHGAGPSYRVITLTQVSDWQSWAKSWTPTSAKAAISMTGTSQPGNTAAKLTAK